VKGGPEARWAWMLVCLAILAAALLAAELAYLAVLAWS
jgi:hypothetical protein